MSFPLLPARLHGWLDELATLSYLVAALAGGLSGPGLWLRSALGADTCYAGVTSR